MSDVLKPSTDSAKMSPTPMHAKHTTSEAAAHPGRWADVAPEVGDKLGFRPDGIPEVITFANWSPNPWTIVGANGKNLATLSNMNLSVIKAITTTGATSLYWTMTVNVVSHGWTSSEPGQPQVQARMQIRLLNSQSGLLETFLPLFYVECGGNGNQTLGGSFTTDIFALIAGANLSLNATFWPC